MLLLSDLAALPGQLLLPRLQKMSHLLRLARAITAVLQTVSQKLIEVIVRQAMYIRLENFCVPIIFIRKKVIEFKFKCLQDRLN